MANDDLVQQFKKLLEENNKHLRQEIREDIKAEVDPLHERLDAQQERFTTLEKNISSVEKNLSSEIHAVKTELTEAIKQETSVIADLIIDHDTQIEELQKAVGLRPKH
jgi:predicted  nucleic acid-binding Zn-ribbon protein